MFSFIFHYDLDKTSALKASLFVSMLIIIMMNDDCVRVKLAF